MTMPLDPDSICLVQSLGENPEVARRLASMGILPGTEVRVVRAGPLGGPIELATDSGQSVALRIREMRGLRCERIAVPLSSSDKHINNTLLRVERLLGGRQLRQKLFERGIGPETQFRRLRLNPLTLLTVPGGREVVLGRGEARKVLVRTVNESGG